MIWSQINILNRILIVEIYNSGYMNVLYTYKCSHTYMYTVLKYHADFCLFISTLYNVSQFFNLEWELFVILLFQFWDKKSLFYDISSMEVQILSVPFVNQKHFLSPVFKYFYDFSTFRMIFSCFTSSFFLNFLNFLNFQLARR